MEEMPPFRSGNTLATRFTGTLTERLGEPVERIPTPGRLLDWLAENALAVTSTSPEEFATARRLRECIHAALAAAADGRSGTDADVRLLNASSAAGRATAELTGEGVLRWRLAAGTVEDALSVIAADAIAILGGAREGRLARCASPTCRAAFLDTSRSRSRRWCDMNTCGNREKKSRLLAKRRAPA